MDQESAQLISILFTRAEQIPFLTPALVIISVVSLLIVVTLLKLWMPTKHVDNVSESNDDSEPKVEGKSEESKAA